MYKYKQKQLRFFLCAIKNKENLIELVCEWEEKGEKENVKIK